jgi:N-acetylmuramoyl-L-alanine amidase
VLTRSDDRYVPLEERTAIANRADADLFISVHVNAHHDRRARGIETYYLDTTDDRYALRLAARENATQEEQVSEAQLALADLATKLNTQQSRALARGVQHELVTHLRSLNPRLRDLGAKGSLFYVLLGARMPAVLVEISFLSNPTEEKLLKSAAYRHRAAEAMARAIAERLSMPLVVARP